MIYFICIQGYDSDVAREKAIDYTTKIYAVSIREMEGTKPHQQLKEVSVEERYVLGTASLGRTSQQVHLGKRYTLRVSVEQMPGLAPIIFLARFHE